MTKHFRSLVMLLAGVLLLNGCATMESTTNVEWQTHQQRLATIDSYQAAGKLGYISPEQRQSLNFQWSHSATLTHLRLTTFLGQTALNLKATPQGAVVETYDDQSYSAPTPQALIQRLTGLNIPVEQLNDWMLGRPTQADDYQLSPTNTLASLTKQVGLQTWQLDYLTYQDVQYAGTALPLPKKIKLTQGSISITLFISNWNLSE
ncbi:lipoprotein insertase outer membrane protein LolB [Vibrio brasiliensis]|jgi:outer membrane lipoprotein LolB|uniref:Outer-membrane lipoprotein LolB n=1 Tax=Vibrio brasiliensis LMG 20546 TaxID=945543 RepID=E8LS40_9VIBR|nr:lipoprotein insertase outer membrane protein LolB [Vibrio brasiliensis]EGA66537.1 outer membrane lipoprotein LolB [Vibrio brasiliensis LMG 20546]MCG9646955.1 lipoprotein insertase outer membrane protein LolB [Vibrio brasiliensis]MCG9725980.1 lipoprotein insertase outer membrane protein LolB [Vibrio brasiliensis]